MASQIVALLLQPEHRHPACAARGLPSLRD